MKCHVAVGCNPAYAYLLPGTGPWMGGGLPLEAKIDGPPPPQEGMVPLKDLWIRGAEAEQRCEAAFFKANYIKSNPFFQKIGGWRRIF